MKCVECNKEIKNKENLRIISKLGFKPMIYCKKCAFSSKLKVFHSSTPMKPGGYLSSMLIIIIANIVLILLSLIFLPEIIGIPIAILIGILTIPLIINYTKTKKLFIST